jgi:hypothetical protein
MNRTKFLRMPYFEEDDELDASVEISRWERVDSQLKGLSSHIQNVILNGWDISVNEEGTPHVSGGSGFINGIYAETTSSIKLNLMSGGDNEIRAKLKIINGDYVVNFSSGIFDGRDGVLLGKILRDGKVINCADHRKKNIDMGHKLLTQIIKKLSKSGDFGRAYEFSDFDEDGFATSLILNEGSSKYIQLTYEDGNGDIELFSLNLGVMSKINNGDILDISESHVIRLSCHSKKKVKSVSVYGVMA